MRVDNLYKKPNGNIGVIVEQAPIENIVLEGGGPKGLVYAGALKVLENKGIMQTVKNVGGSSAGAINALIIGLGNTADRMQEILYEQNIGELTDLTEEDTTGRLGGLIKARAAMSNLLFGSEKKGRGLYLGDELQGWIRSIISARLQDALALESDSSSQRYQLASTLINQRDVTFADLAQLGKLFPELSMKTMCFTGTNYTDKTLDVFNIYETPDMPVSLAIRISSSLPWFYESIKYNGKEYIDGGCLDNYPMGIFDAPPFLPKNRPKLTSGIYGQNLCTLGFKVETVDEIRRIIWEGGQEDDTGAVKKLLNGVRNKVVALCVGVDYIGADRACEQAVYGKYGQRTIQIPDLDYSTFNFDLTNKDKDKITQSGKDATMEWLSLYYDGVGIELELSDLQELSSYVSPAEFEKAQQWAADL